MAYWRMQLHPDESKQAVKHTVESLSAGYIGLDFNAEVGDLTVVAQDTLPREQRDYYPFAHGMKIGDYVLIFTHHFPFALVKIVGDYNYIKATAPELGVWFRHFRKIKVINYYADYITNARNWQHITMTDTISPLINEDTQSKKLIEELIKEHEAEENV